MQILLLYMVLGWCIEMDLMTPKQHQFARELVLGKSQADAYRSAYHTLKMNDNSIRREVSRLMDNPNVATTVVELQQKADAAVVQERIASREEVLQTLTGYMHSGEPRDSIRLRAAVFLSWVEPLDADYIPES
jgi:hypothetical protein